MNEPPEWRRFEQLVARIEKAAAPKKAVVTSPDRIRDLETGQMREVDASIKYQIGTTDILITIECRLRKRKQDDTWIEQLATKRSKLGADKTIAVSSSGFTDSAYLTAKKNNIVLRSLFDIEHSEIHDWFLPGGAVQVFRVIEDVLCVFYLRRDDGTAEDEPLGIVDAEQPVFYHDLIRSPFPTSVLFEIIAQKNPESFFSVPLDGSKKRLEFRVGFPPDDLTVVTETGERDIHHLIINGLVSYETAVLPMEDGEHHVYTSSDGDLIQHTSFHTEMFGLPVRFDHQADKEGNQQASVRFNPEEGEEEV